MADVHTACKNEHEKYHLIPVDLLVVVRTEALQYKYKTLYAEFLNQYPPLITYKESREINCQSTNLPHADRSTAQLLAPTVRHKKHFSCCKKIRNELKHFPSQTKDSRMNSEADVC